MTKSERRRSTSAPAGGGDTAADDRRADGLGSAGARRGDVVFGHPGGAILPTYDALSPLEAEGKIHHVLVRHEQCAAHMADGYARVTGEVGVCIATSGPGATNLVTGLATAQMDSVPVVAITGQVPTNLAGHRRLPGIGCGGRHPAGLQAQLSGHRRQRTAPHSQRSLLYRP